MGQNIFRHVTQFGPLLIENPVRTKYGRFNIIFIEISGLSLHNNLKLMGMIKIEWKGRADAGAG